MKIKYSDSRIIIYLFKEIEANSLNDFEIYLKDLIVHLKKCNYKIGGLFKTNFYINKKYGVIIDMKKEDEIDFFPELVDLKISIVNDADIFLEFDDFFNIINCKDIYYFENKYYISINDISHRDVLVLSDFYRVIYGHDMDMVKGKLIKL